MQLSLGTGNCVIAQTSVLPSGCATVVKSDSIKPFWPQTIGEVRWNRYGIEII